MSIVKTIQNQHVLMAMLLASLFAYIVSYALYLISEKAISSNRGANQMEYQG